MYACQTKFGGGQHGKFITVVHFCSNVSYCQDDSVFAIVLRVTQGGVYDRAVLCYSIGSISTMTGLEGYSELYFRNHYRKTAGLRRKKLTIKLGSVSKVLLQSCQ